MKFNDYYNTILEAERGKEPKSNVQLPDGTWRRVNSDGDVFYSKTNNSVNYHRLDGPAVEYADGRKYWYVNGKHHRLDGPAIEYADGSKYWYVDGEQYNEEDFNAIVGASKDSAVIKQRAASNNLFM